MYFAYSTVYDGIAKQLTQLKTVAVNTLALTEQFNTNWYNQQFTCVSKKEAS